MSLHSPEAGDVPFSILTVCMGNICRSPLAEQLLKARLREAGLGSDVVVSSAGLGALEGHPMDVVPAEISRRLGGDPSNSHGRQLRSTIVDGADLILTMTRDQRDSVIKRYPRALRKVFTLAEFNALSPQVEPTFNSATESRKSRLRSACATLSQRRSTIRLTLADDIDDPYRQSRAIHERVGEQIAKAGDTAAFALIRWVHGAG